MVPTNKQCGEVISTLKNNTFLAGWLNLGGHYPIRQKAVGWIPGQGKYLGCRFGPQGLGVYQRQPIDVSFSYRCLSLSLSLSLSSVSISLDEDFEKIK